MSSVARPDIPRDRHGRAPSPGAAVYDPTMREQAGWPSLLAATTAAAPRAVTGLVARPDAFDDHDLGRDINTARRDRDDLEAL